MPEDGEQLMRRFLGYWASRNAEAMIACFAEDGVYDNVPDGKPMVGRAAIKAWLDACFGHLTCIDVEILRHAINGEWILSERIDDHIVGEKHMPLPVMNATRIVDGQIVMFRDYYCRKTVAELRMG
jgi:limonene-1,2-epoxide hydrolase